MENNEYVYANYLEDLASILLEKLKNLENEITNCDENDKDYFKGQIIAYYDILTILKSQSEAFGIEILNLQGNLDLERYLTLR
ncbi:hypothetical protein [Flavobacterium columnare]|uniref:hypothetical protein n=1 Tax=Flavobacterium columnare TaxID=996 RepID=UPI0013D5E2C4|nr:hypothetical protein [Flavobacterium columnare]